jgi:flagellar protein FlgJ
MAAIPSGSTLLSGSGRGSSESLAIDARAGAMLKSRAASDPKGAAKDVAKQFESLFMQELMKSMRKATESSGLLENEGTQLGQEMLDTQLATKMTGLPGGLSEAIARQLERQMGLNPGPIPRNVSANKAPEDIARPGAATRIPQTGAAAFVDQHEEAAAKAEQATGIPAAFMISQAAHETGWGRKEIRHADGTPAFNLFGIKAGANWKGAVADITTTEYVNGKAQKVVQKFRAYASYEESFADYARLMQDSPRYAKVVAAGADARGFAQGLQKAGYATDPAYAEKLAKVINTTLRLQRAAT